MLSRARKLAPLLCNRGKACQAVASSNLGLRPFESFRNTEGKCESIDIFWLQLQKEDPDKAAEVTETIWYF